MKKPYKLKPHEKRDVIGRWDDWLWVRRATMFMVPHLCWIYVEPDGGPVLLGEESWRKISGIQFHIGTWQMWMHFRRWGSGA